MMKRRKWPLQILATDHCLVCFIFFLCQVASIFSGSNASANFETYHDTIATRARVWAGQGPDPFSKSGKKDPNRPIMVTEIKSFLYAFCGRQRSLPEYETKPAGRDKNGWMSYFSTVAPTGFPYVGQGTAQTRKEAQTAAAWDFIDYLVKQAIVSEMDLPLREE